MSKVEKPIKLLFVCMGNICRSPSAEGIMEQIVSKKGLSDFFECDSAGTIAYHAGEPADARMQKHAKQRGYQLNSISRPLREADYFEFDYILGMDSENMHDINGRIPSGSTKAKIALMTDYCKKNNPGYVPDPYYGGDEGFEQVLDILEDACDSFLNHLTDEYKI